MRPILEPMRRLATIALVAVAAACSGGGASAGRAPADAAAAASAAASPSASASAAPEHANPSAAPGGAATAEGAAAAAGTDPIRAPASEAGLRRLVREAMTAVAGGHDAAARRLVDSFRLPHPKAWFAHTFGRHLGHRLAASYRPAAAHIDEMIVLFRKLESEGRTRVVVERFTAPTPAVVGYQKLALERMKRRVPLYSVRIVKPGQDVGFHLWSFVHAGGTFRWVGKMKRLAPPTAGQGGDAGPDPLELRLREAQKLKQIAEGAGAATSAKAGADRAAPRR